MRRARSPVAHRAGRLFIWRQSLLPGWERGKADEREFAFDPAPSVDGAGEFHIGSICTATILPVVENEATPSTGSIDLDTIDHGRKK